MKTLKILSAAAVLLDVSGSAFADSTYYISGTGAGYGDNYVIRYAFWKDSENTSEANWPVATRDYTMGGPREYIVANGDKSAMNFGGRSLQVGYHSGDVYQFSKVYFNANGGISCTGDGGLILTHGFFENWQANGWMYVGGKVTVKSTADKPFYFMHAKTDIGGVQFSDGSLHGDATADMLITRNYNRSVDQIRAATQKYPMQAAIYSTLDDYNGTIEFGDGLGKVAIGGVGVTVSGTTCPGTLQFGATNTLDLAGSPSNALTVANLKIGTDFTIRVQPVNVGGADICSSLEVTNSLTMPVDSPIKVALSVKVPYVNPETKPVRRFEFLKVKKSVKELSPSDFILDAESFAPSAGSLYLYDGAKIGVDYDPASDLQTVYFVFDRIYTLNTSSTGASAFNAANITYWNGHQAGDAIDPDGVYFQSSVQYLQFGVSGGNLPDGGWKFPGRKLVMNNGANAVLGGNKAKYLQFDDLVMRAGSFFLNWGIGAVGYWDFGADETYLNSLVWGVFKGNLTLCQYNVGGWESVTFVSSGAWNSTTSSGTPRGYVLDMDIHGGSRPLLSIGSKDASILLTSYVCLAGDNSDMKCPVVVNPHCNTAVWELGPQLLFYEGRNLGGACADNVGIWLNNGTTLWALGTTAIEASGRSLYIGHEDAVANVKVSSGKTLTLKNPLNVAGELRKRGAGNFVLGGVFHSCTGNLVKLDVPVRDANRRVTVEEGSIEGAHVDCLKDALVSFKEGTTLVAHRPSEEDPADFRQYGIRGRCDGVWRLFDFTSEGNLAYVPVKFVIDTENFDRGYSFPLFTVSAGEASAIDVRPSRVDLAGEPAKGFPVTIGKVTNGDGSVTFTASVRSGGTVLLVK